MCTAPLVYRIDLKFIVVLVFIIGLAFYHILLIAGINGLDYVRFKRETEGANEKYGISTKKYVAMIVWGLVFLTFTGGMTALTIVRMFINFDFLLYLCIIFTVFLYDVSIFMIVYGIKNAVRTVRHNKKNS